MPIFTLIADHKVKERKKERKSVSVNIIVGKMCTRCYCLLPL